MSLRSPAQFVAPAERLVRGAGWWRRPGVRRPGGRCLDQSSGLPVAHLRNGPRIADGGELGAESSVTKVFWSDLDVALHQTALDLRGPDAELAGPGRRDCCSPWAARSTPVPTRFNAISSPNDSSACPKDGSLGLMKFALDHEQHEFRGEHRRCPQTPTFRPAVRA